MDQATDDEITEPTRWKKAGWIAQVIKNEDDDGWAVAMTRIGDSDPALVGPWTMGRDKRNPKPLDAGAFATLVKTASEVLRRHEQAARERLHKTLSFTTDDGRRVWAWRRRRRSAVGARPSASALALGRRRSAVGGPW